MKLVRFGEPGREKPGILDAAGDVHDLSRYVVDWNPGCLADVDLLNTIRRLNLKDLPLVDKTVRIGACISQPGKIIYIGYNSKQHAKEMGLNVDKEFEPIVFMKPGCVISGPYDPILYGRFTKKLDWEAELAVIIGKQGKYISVNDASDYIFGYACSNDLSDRYFQLETPDKQFTKGKCFDGAAPIGPYLVTQDEIKDSSRLRIQLWVNGELRQDFKTADYTHDDKKIISFLSQYFTLYPGDIISMGSAPGSAVSWGAQFLKPHDKVELSITNLGKQEQVVSMESL